MEWIQFQREATVKLFTSLLKSGQTLKGKNLFPHGANYFILKQTSFSKGVNVQESQNTASLVKKVERLLSVRSSFKIFKNQS